MRSALSDPYYQQLETYQPEHNQPKDIARNVRVKRREEACLLGLIVCRFQHGRLLLCERSVLVGASAPMAFPFTLRIGSQSYRNGPYANRGAVRVLGDVGPLLCVPLACSLGCF